MHVLIPALHRPIKPTGVCRHAANLAHCLADLDRVNRITLLIGQWQTAYFEQAFHFESPKIQVVSVDIKNSALDRNRWFMFGLPQLCQKLKPDVIHMSFPFPFVRQWFSVPVVSTIHDLYPYEYPENFGYPQVWFNQLFLHQCIANSDGLSCVSKCSSDALVSYFPQVQKRKQLEVIYNVVDFSGIHPKRPHQLTADPADPFFLTVAQHRKNKNLDLLIQVYNNLLREERLETNTKLFIVGSSGPETETLIELVKTLKLEHQVQFFSGLDDGELRWLYEEATLFVIPSSTEGFCLPLAEALTLSCPVVCSDIPIFKEVGSETCTYFQLSSDPIVNLATAIIRSMETSCSKASSVNQKFSKPTIAQKLLDFYALVDAKAGF